MPAEVARSRLPIDPARVSALLAGGGRWRVTHTSVTGSTNADLAAMRAEPHGLVLTTEEQLTGRGRSGRDWLCPAGAGLMFSVLLRLPQVPAERRGWTGAVLGVAIVRALDSFGVRAQLKWPNDVLIDGAKCAGILGEVADGALVVGAGINVSLQAAELPRADATSLWLAGPVPGTEPAIPSGDGGPLDRAALLAAILDRFGELIEAWAAATGDIDAAGLRADYRSVCATIGARVRLLLPGGGRAVGTAVDVAPDGALLVRDDAGRQRVFAAADVVHLRPDR